MAYFSEAKEVEHFIGGIFIECLSDPELGPKFEETGTVLKLNFSEPDSTVLVDCGGRKVFTGAAVPSGPEPNVEMWMTADVGHEYWLGKVQVAPALAKGQMRAKGPVPRILKLVPLTRHVFPRYEKMIESSGRAELKGS